MKKTFFVLLLFAVACQRQACRTGYEGSSLEKGKYLYEMHCASCHGSKGDGQGAVAQFLWPKPRDFTKGILKYRTGRGPIPSDLDLLQTMYLGIPGTAMPGWYLLKKEDWESLLSYLKTFSPLLMNAKASPPMDIPEEPKKTLESIPKGKKLYENSGCVACHGMTGDGNGPGAAFLTDVWGNKIVPRDLRAGPMKWGTTPRDIYRTLSLGVPGTPMPAFEHTFTPSQIWNLVHYIQSIQKPVPQGYNLSDPKGNLLVIKKIGGEIPLDYEDKLWEEAPANPVFLKPLWVEPKATEWLTVKALHNGKDVAFYIRWSDDQMNIETDKSDAVAIQWPGDPVSNPIDLPYLGMGSKSKEVEIWQWKGGIFLDWRATGIDQLKLQKASKQDVNGKGTYDRGEWHVIFKRAEEGALQRLGYFSFALWDNDLPTHPGPESFSEWVPYQLEESD